MAKEQSTLNLGDTRTNATGLRTTAHLGIYGSKPRSVFAVMRRNSGRSAAMLINIGTLGVPGGYFGLCDQSDSLWLPSGGFTNGILKNWPNCRLHGIFWGRFITGSSPEAMSMERCRARCGSL